MRVLALALLLAALAAPAALAKGNLRVTLSDRTPGAGQAFTVHVRTDYVVPVKDWLRLIAVAPGKNWQDVVAAAGGDSARTVSLPRDGFEIKLTRTGARTWRAVVRLPRVGRWRLVVPNGTHTGYMLPPPTAWMPWVTVHA
jgi:hypothetical protein